MAADNTRTTPIPLQCKECGVHFERSGRSATAYCSPECRAEHKRKNRRNPITPQCEMCGKGYVRTSGVQKFCTECKAIARREYRKSYYAANADILRPVARSDASARRSKNPEIALAAGRKWRSEHWEEILSSRRAPQERQKSNARQNARYKNDVKHSINASIRSGIYESLKGEKGGRRWEDLVGYNLSDLMTHIERQFIDGMSWSNRSDWHIDHILPLASFKFTSSTDKEFRAAWSLTNLRPLWAKDNMSKGAKVLMLV